MRADMRVIAAALMLGVMSSSGQAQSAADGPVLGAKRVMPDAAFKVWMPAGKIRMVAWDRDSLLVRGRVATGENFYLAGDSAGMKLGVEHQGSGESSARSSIVVY